MAECNFCNQEMTDAESCTKTAIIIGGITHEAIPYGEEPEWQTNDRCHDCGVKPGEYHHPGCDVERDPTDPEQQLLKRVIYSHPDHQPRHARLMDDPHADVDLEGRDDV